MNAFATWPGFSAALPAVSLGLVVIVKWTVVLTLAWLAHGMLARRNPHWRVALWRTILVGLALVGILSGIPPIVTYHFVPRNQPLIQVVPTAPTTSSLAVRGAPEVDTVRIQAGIPWGRRPAAADPSHPRSDFPAGVAGVAAGKVGKPPGVTVMVGRNDPAPREGQGFRWRAGILSGLWTIWLIGVLVLLARLIIGSLSLVRMVRRSAEAPDAIVRGCREIAKRLGCHQTVRVLSTKDIATPCLAGLWRLVLLMPEQECEDARPDDLRSILAHELAHARNHDVAWNLVAHVASIVLWFHPLAWRIRAAHVAACDAVCDAVAADLLGDVISYGRTLARLAVRAAGPAPVHGLAMARTSDVRRRLEALNRKVFRTPLSWRRVMPAIFVGSLFLVLIGGFGFTRAEQAATTPKSSNADKLADPNPAGKLALRAVSAETNEPIEGVFIEYRARIDDGKLLRATIMTGEDGTTAIEWPAAATVHMLWFTARALNRVPIHIAWDDDRHPVKLPLRKELRFEPGTTIGGIVKDEVGQPIEGATVDVHAPPTEYEKRNSAAFTLGSSKTDAQGHWRLDVAPKDLSEVWVAVTHPVHQRTSSPVSRKLDSVTILKKGLTVKGRVVDAAGRPVRGARAMFGPEYLGWPGPPEGTTNERGEFTLENCEPGRSIITVQVEGFAPRIEDLRVEEKAAPLEIRMTEPGSVVRVRVVDVQGKPIVGAHLGAHTWRGHRSIEFQANTDQDGRLAWRSAPRDVVLYVISHKGYMRIETEFAASERERTITLHPKLVISGHVTDAETGRPAPKFRAIQGRKWGGRDRIAWSEDMAIEATGGQYTVSFDEGDAFLRIDAPDYKSAVSRAFQANEGSQTLDFALHPAKGYSGLVLLPDGKPAPGAEVALGTEGNPVSIRSGRLDPNWEFPKTSTGPDGRFTFPARDDKFLLVAVSEAGYAEASSDEFAKSGKLMLQPWGRIEGGVRIGPRFGSDQEVMFQPLPRNRAYFSSFGYTTRTDERGQFRFDWVIPGSGIISRSVVTKLSGGGSRHLPGWRHSVEVKPGQTVPVTIGGKGRPVIGRIVLVGTPESPIDWTRNEPVELGWAASNLDKDGRFRIEDVFSGQHTLDLRVCAPNHGPGTYIARVKRDFTVPEMPGGRSNEPLDLGTITVKLDALQIGELAPDFDVERIGTPEKGRRLKLSDYRGKLVLLNFWEAYWGADNPQGDMTVLKDVQQTFGSDPRFVLISLACAKDAAQAEGTIKEAGLNWTHGFIGDLASGVAPRYKIRAFEYMVFNGPDRKQRRVPLTFLIGPDGRIVAHDLLGTDLEAVSKALNDDKLFPATIKTTQPPSSR